MDFAALAKLITAAWDTEDDSREWPGILKRSLCWVCAHQGASLTGFVNVA